MQSEIDAVSVVWFHDRQLRERDWPVMSHVTGDPGGLVVWEWIDANHRYNGLLWREEDRARRLSSETAGAMIDRLSILALKVHHMRAQTQRADADDIHVRACTAKLDRLLAQRRDLMSCLDLLLTEARAGRAYFKLYRQFKMYNDPTLNPYLNGQERATP